MRLSRESRTGWQWFRRKCRSGSCRLLRRRWELRYCRSVDLRPQRRVAYQARERTCLLIEKVRSGGDAQLLRSSRTVYAALRLHEPICAHVHVFSGERVHSSWHHG